MNWIKVMIIDTESTVRKIMNNYLNDSGGADAIMLQQVPFPSTGANGGELYMFMLEVADTPETVDRLSTLLKEIRRDGVYESFAYNPFILLSNSKGQYLPI